MRRRAERARVARLATVAGDGQPHLVPCCFAIVGDRFCTAVDDIKPKSTRSLRRLDNIRRHPEISVLVDHYDDDWSALWWIRLDGRARLVEAGSVEHDEAKELLAAKYEQYHVQPPEGTVITADITTWRAWP